MYNMYNGAITYVHVLVQNSWQLKVIVVKFSSFIAVATGAQPTHGTSVSVVCHSLQTQKIIRKTLFIEKKNRKPYLFAKDTWTTGKLAHNYTAS